MLFFVTFFHCWLYKTDWILYNIFEICRHVAPPPVRRLFFTPERSSFYATLEAAGGSGAVGGVVGSAVLCGIFGYFFYPTMMVHCMIIGVLGGMVAEAGDLTASMFKRGMGIKDYGHLIPGHGGIMDRFDSVIFVAPAVCYYILFVLV